MLVITKLILLVLKTITICIFDMESSDINFWQNADCLDVGDIFQLRGDAII